LGLTGQKCSILQDDLRVIGTLHFTFLAFHKAKELVNLVRLGLSAHVLQIDQFRNAGISENKMAAPDPQQLEAKALNQTDQIV
jgi:hypothetical protein